MKFSVEDRKYGKMTMTVMPRSSGRSTRIPETFCAFPGRTTGDVSRQLALRKSLNAGCSLAERHFRRKVERQSYGGQLRILVDVLRTDTGRNVRPRRANGTSVFPAPDVQRVQRFILV